MATYQYRCPADGVLEVSRPIGTAEASVACPRCSEPAPRVFSSPMLGLAPRPLMAAIDRTRRTSAEPDVVAAPPPRPGSRRQGLRDPTLPRLPRP